MECEYLYCLEIKCTIGRIKVNKFTPLHGHRQASFQPLTSAAKGDREDLVPRRFGADEDVLQPATLWRTGVRASGFLFKRADSNKHGPAAEPFSNRAFVILWLSALVSFIDDVLKKVRS